MGTREGYKSKSKSKAEAKRKEFIDIGMWVVVLS